MSFVSSGRINLVTPAAEGTSNAIVSYFSPQKSTPHWMSQFYRGGVHVSYRLSANIPTTGKILFSNFYGVTKIDSASTIYETVYGSPVYALAANLLGAYSCRVVRPEWMDKPVFTLRRSTDGALQDFYTDGTQSYLTTGAYNTGDTFATWVSGATAYVHTWYDQSGKNANATNTNNNSTQPNIASQTTNGKTAYVIQFQRANSTVLAITGVQPNSVFCTFWNNNTTAGTILSTAYDYGIRFGFSGGTNILGGTNGGDWYYSGGGTKLSYNNGVSTTTVLVSGWNTMSLVVQTPAWLTSQTSGNTSSFTRIGQDGYNITARSVNGYMPELLLLSKTFVASDLVEYNNRRFFTANNIWDRPNSPSGVPGKVRNVTVTAQAFVSWTPPVDAGIADHYYIYASGNNASTTIGRIYDTSYTIYGFANKTQYDIYVFAYNAAGSGEWSDPVTIITNFPVQKASGGSVTTSGSEYIHRFTTTGSNILTVNEPLVAEVLIVAGGGAGGSPESYGAGGGGGAGGLVYYSSTSLAAGSYTVVVGNGGIRTTRTGGNGGNSYISGLTVAIGGGGGASSGYDAQSGGSGGGRNTSRTPFGYAGNGTAGQGNKGGDNGFSGYNSTWAYCGTGGGGAGGAGQDASSTKSGDGGIGLEYSISGSAVYYAGGGSGGCQQDTDASTSVTSGLGGQGGGGRGAYCAWISGSMLSVGGTNGLGGGGGGGAWGINIDGSGYYYAPSDGGSGIVIVRYSGY